MFCPLYATGTRLNLNEQEIVDVKRNFRLHPLWTCLRVGGSMAYFMTCGNPHHTANLICKCLRWVSNKTLEQLNTGAKEKHLDYLISAVGSLIIIVRNRNDI